MKKIALILVLVLVAGIAAGCMGTPVIYYTNCTCPTGSHGTNVDTTKPTVGEGAVKTGLAIVANTTGSKDAEKADYDVTLVAVLVDDEGIIRDCIIDSIGTTVKFDATGTITTDVTAPIQTKNELGDAYGMVNAGAVAEWYQQADALAQFAIGKTVAEFKSGAVDATGKAPAGSDLASSATIYLGGYVAAVEVAVNNAKHLGAQGGDELRLAAMPSLKANNATAENVGAIELNCDVTALTVKDSVITSCYNTGDVSGSYYVGGVVGDNYGTVSNCYNTGTVSGSSDYVGGVVGANSSSGTVSNSRREARRTSTFISPSSRLR